jgi:hypothetical protein
MSSSDGNGTATPITTDITATCHRQLKHAVKLGDLIGNQYNHHVTLLPTHRDLPATISLCIKEVDNCGVAPKLWYTAISLIEYIVTRCNHDPSFMRGKR